MLGFHVGVEVLEPQAVIQRQSLDGPLILSEDSKIRLDSVPRQIGPRILGDLDRDTVVERVRDGLVEVGFGILDTFLLVDSGLERVGTGDVRHREPLCDAVAGREGPQRVCCVVPETRRLLYDGNIVGGHVRLTGVRVIGLRKRKPGFEQEPAGHRRRPASLVQPLWPEVVYRLRFRREISRPSTIAPGLRIDEHADLVFRGHLPGQTGGVRFE